MESQQGGAMLQRKVRKVLLLVGLTAGMLAVWGGAAAAAETEYTVTIREHKFEPAELVVPAGQRFKLIVINADATPEEFESHSLRREKVIPGNSRAVLMMGPLKPGSYEFVGEFHEATAKGKLIAK